MADGSVSFYVKVEEDFAAVFKIVCNVIEVWLAGVEKLWCGDTAPDFLEVIVRCGDRLLIERNGCCTG